MTQLLGQTLLCPSILPLFSIFDLPIVPTIHSFSILALATGGLLSPPLSSIPSLENPRPSAWATRRVSPTWIIKRRIQDGFLSAQVICGQERPHTRRLLREFTLNHASEDFGGWMIYFVAQDLSTTREGQSTPQS
ncbi:hypothetical protein PRIPAC_76995 [Pristionchus pacificus]|uniref:Uncharacterized protein n=1 Tax=Pristionchus pacificus TaxID=54126 RepID=A0A2A6CAJ6_PRIPA|nr:hypothetical protein PRIPAC_76995 [Pristionchus pacificus]|eukprot:PDM75204.1 hypothetical protein PRIPAC_43398 [Pristionchus pacificus]